MTADDRAWVQLWRQTGPALEQIRREELSVLRHVDHAAAIDGLLQLGWDHRQPREDCGLVELERWLAKSTR